MNPAIVIVDMVKDTFKKENKYPVAAEARAVIPRINNLLKQARSIEVPIIFACDSFLPGDFIFKGKMQPHSLRGTEGSEVTDLLDVANNDIYLPKRRFSAFFKTDLDQTLRTWGIDTVVVGGIATNVCVLMTVMDALCHDFKAVFLEDCCAAHKPNVHATTIENYRNFALYPLLRIMTSEDFIKEIRTIKEEI